MADWRHNLIPSIINHLMNLREIVRDVALPSSVRSKHGHQELPFRWVLTSDLSPFYRIERGRERERRIDR